MKNKQIIWKHTIFGNKRIVWPRVFAVAFITLMFVLMIIGLIID